jgi:hypothetical protein
LTRHVGVVQDPVFDHFAGFFFPPPNGILQTLREFQYKKWDLLCAALCDLAAFCCSLTLHSNHCNHLLVIFDHF